MLLSKYEVESAFTIRDLQLSDRNFWGTRKGKDLQPDASLFVITVLLFMNQCTQVNVQLDK